MLGSRGDEWIMGLGFPMKVKYEEALEALPLKLAQQGKRFAMQTQQIIKKSNSMLLDVVTKRE